MTHFLKDGVPGAVWSLFPRIVLRVKYKLKAF